MMPEIVRFRLTHIVLWTSIFATCIILPFSNYDPISLPKLAVISVGAFSSLFLLILYRNSFKVSHRPLIIVVSMFIIWMIVVLLFSNAPLTQQIWGMFGRNTGLVAYLSLVLILLASCISSSENFDFPRRLVTSVIGVSILETAYCLIQIQKRDPIAWSEMQPFGTLGNVNFLSAFLGLSTVLILNVVISNSINSKIRISLLALLLLQLYVIYYTGSIQGLMMFGIGSFVSLLFRFLASAKAKLILTSLVLPYLAVGALSLLALFNKGPLASFIFQPSITFRWDYMHAGVEMTQKSPLLGVGLDSYGDWYRELRGELSTLRTGPDRITNSAHNIFLDISSTGGLPFFLLYMIFVVWALLGCYKLLKRARFSFNPWHAAIVAGWISYQVQALISINQLGVGIWAWVLTGTLISFSASRFGNLEPQDLSEMSKAINMPKNLGKKLKSSKMGKSLKGELMPAKATLSAFLGAAIGLAICLPALNADSRVYRAFQSGDLAKMVGALKGLGVTSWHMEIVLDRAVKNNDPGAAREVISLLKSANPRSYYAYFIEYVSATSTPQERENALAILRKLDPFNPNL